jgi:SagB-type dehydrogenase family enzyme
MSNSHSLTDHTYNSVRKNQYFLDWTTQPESLKKYPHFYKRFKVSQIRGLENLNLMNKVFYKKITKNSLYTLRTVPSAGALYPCEIYLQIRGVKGVLSGIYHYEVSTESICLLQEIENDGIEYYFPNQNIQKGIIFLVSAVYFRSSWKYKDRAMRYIMLDSGHQLGAIYLSSIISDKKSKIDFNFDKLALNNMFGFREDEMFFASFSHTETIDKIAKPLKNKMPYVAACDYIENNSYIYDTYNKSVSYEEEPISIPKFFDNTNKADLTKAIINRRSIRAFYGDFIEGDNFEYITADIFEFANKNDIDIYYTIQKVNNIECGLYKNGKLLQSGNFSKESGFLALEQNLGKDGSVTFYFISKNDEKYQKINILSGFIAHIIYIRSELLGIGCSGIGAYYDNDVKKFLNVDSCYNILYMLAIGK